ncbi:MAG: hypothetical protein HY370_03100 [Proteobacteria bacterium]|nr:hypothetical protein [Pseudomonadota bacterium]
MMTMLFHASSLEAITRIPDRPLGAFSDYVVETLPARLEDGDGEAMRRGIYPLIPEGLTQNFNKIALLDLKMVFTACGRMAVRCGTGKEEFLNHPVHRKLMEAIRQVSPSTPYIITYDDIVINNPESDPRVFTTGRVGYSEKQFYRGHRIIEGHLDASIGTLKEVLSGAPSPIPLLETCHESLRGAQKALALFLTELRTEDFLAFKPFFDTNGYTGEKGPSGAFSAKAPHVDILVYGRNLPPGCGEYLNANADYFPEGDLKAALNSLADGASLFDMCRNPAMQDCRAVCGRIAACLVGFRKLHLKTVLRHIGQGAHGSAEGKFAAGFLESRVRAFEGLRKDLDNLFAVRHPGLSP